MSQAVITKAFSEWKAQQAINNQPVTLDEFIFAYIPDLDVDKPVSNTETIPAADKIVHRQPVSKSGVVNGDSVVYSVTLGADVGDFDFNWVGLVNKATSTLAMIIHAPTQSKIKTASGQQGNVLVRSMLMEYSGAQAATGITTPAETWQIDFTARLSAMDERQRLENIDLYGAAAFFDTGYLVAKTGNQFYVTKGAGYVAGLRAELAANLNIAVSTKPIKVWLDVSWSGTLTSEWVVKSKITVAANLTNYAESGVPHFVFALASIDASGNVTDLRPKGTLNEQVANDALKAHEKSRNHPDATTSEKGFVQLSSETGSDDESKAATPKAVSAAVKELKETLGSVAGEDAVTSMQDTTAGRVPVVGWMGLGAIRDTKIQDENFPSFWRDTSIVKSGITIPYDGSPTVSYLAVDGANQHAYIGRKKDGAAISWVKIYSEFYKPTTKDIFASTESIGAAADLNDYIAPGLYYQGANANAVNGKNYPEESMSGSLAVYKNAGGITQVYRIYSTSRCWSRSMYNGSWSVWARQYDTVNKPSPAEIGAVNKAGDTMTNLLAVKASGNTVILQPAADNLSYYLRGRKFDNTDHWYFGQGSSSSDVISIGNNKLGSALSLTSGGVTVSGFVIPSVYSNFDARYQTKGSYAVPSTASRGANGWFQDSSTGLIYQWCQGATVNNEANHTVTFPKAFPSACLFASVSTLNVSNNDNAEQHYHLVSKTTANCVVKPNRAYGSNGNVAPLIWAVGY